MAKLLYYSIKLCEFELQSRYYDYFAINTHEKGIEPLYPPAMS